LSVPICTLPLSAGLMFDNQPTSTISSLKFVFWLGEGNDMLGEKEAAAVSPGAGATPATVRLNCIVATCTPASKESVTGTIAVPPGVPVTAPAVSVF
jgi:hypothetical protein